MARHNTLGKIGEDAACSYLAAKGYAIMERNARVGHLEIDIVAMVGPRLVCAEVKTRTAGTGFSGIEGITKAKIKSLVRAADAYVKSRNLPFEVQFDILLVSANDDGDIIEIEHIPDAFYPPF